jgi:CheY-like chemotaxis protein
VKERVVLVVDDEMMIEDMINTVLVAQGFRTASFGDPEMALAFFREHNDIIDLVITDFSMPGMQGGELARRMADINSEIPIVLITGFMGHLRKAACTPNIKIVLEKPTPRKLLLQTVHALVHR